ncbi:hypothetical protein QFC24_000754 [Naganishia onofrii]|uniref:Uncharacterized protein n=1 Tax=Naganishia onofrii TaxID=1851511 RepID=A0ACC2XVS2_9TREE|nr:hypothetical protein QFC24_000754 [Naganishia onofrii]
MEKPIPKEEMDIFKTLIAEALHKADPKIQFELMGMYRRGERLSLDIDIAVWHVSYVRADQERIAEDVMELVKNALVAAGLMGSERVFQSGKKKCMFLTRVPQSHAHLLSSDEEGQVATLRALEVRVCPVESVPYFLLANTGDDMLMKVIRKAAKSR